MKPLISKSPDVPSLSTEEMAFLTTLTFGKKMMPQPCDVLFIFSGTHPSHWEKANKA